MIIIPNVFRVAVYGHVGLNSIVHSISLDGSDWLVPFLLYRPLLYETNERTLLNAFNSSR